MRLDQFITRLQDHLELHPDAEVKLATQPAWPLVQKVARITHEADLERPQDEQGFEGDDARDIVWIALDGADYDENPYAPRDVWGGGAY